MLFSVKEGRVPVGTSSLDWARFGSGPKTLVLLPGLSLRTVKGAGLGLAAMYRAFCKDCTVWVLDRKNEPEEGCTIRSLAADTLAAMDALGIEKADFFGVSQGGMVAQEIALARPDRVGRLVLAVTCGKTNPVLQSAVEGWLAFAQRDDWAGLVYDMMPRMYSEKYLKKYRLVLPVLARMGKPKDPVRFIRLAKACLTCDTADRLPELACPVFVLGGGADRVVGDGAEQLARTLGCKVKIYAGLGHAAYEEAADFNRQVLDFLKE